jgi:hypothetical protein
MGNIPAAKLYLSGCGFDQLKGGLSGCRLSASAFTHKPKSFSLVNVKRHPVYGKYLGSRSGQESGSDGKMFFEIAHFQ